MTVFITQEVRKLSPSGDAYQPQYNFKPALKYGTLKVLVPSGMSLLSPVPLVRELKQKLADYNDDDYLIAIGDPSVIAVASAIASQRNNGKFKVLKWDKELKDYLPVEIDISGRTI